MDNEIKGSILTSIKLLLGATEEFASYDSAIIIHINSVFMTLYELGVGPKTGFAISDKTKTWEDYTTDNLLFNYLQTYVYLKVLLIFDPPTSSNVLDSVTRQITECEWRIKTYVEDFKEEDIV